MEEVEEVKTDSRASKVVDQSKSNLPIPTPELEDLVELLEQHLDKLSLDDN